MQVLYGVCCGLDVHKKEITAALMSGEDAVVVKTFGTTTNELKTMVKWLQESKCEHVAMESTGVYWKPVFNILEEDFEVILVNARHVKMYLVTRQTRKTVDG